MTQRMAEYSYRQPALAIAWSYNTRAVPLHVILLLTVLHAMSAKTRTTIIRTCTANLHHRLTLFIVNRSVIAVTNLFHDLVLLSYLLYCVYSGITYRGVVANFDLVERFPRPRSQQRGSLRPRARRVAVLEVGAGGGHPGKFFRDF